MSLLNVVLMNIVHLTTILPVQSSFKKFDNDILIRIAVEYEKKSPGSKHHFILIVPYSNWFFALFKSKWKDYAQIIKKASVVSEGFLITVVGMPGFRYDIHFRKLLARLGYKLFSKRIRKTIQHIKPDIVHAHNMLSSIELAELINRDYGFNYLVTARSIHHRVLNRIQKGKLNPSAIISHNQVATKRCQGVGVPAILITHPIDSVFFKETCSSFKTNKTQLNIISVCGLVKLKNINQVISALKIIGSGFTYTIIGDGPEKKTLKLWWSRMVWKTISFSMVMHRMKQFHSCLLIKTCL